MTETDTRFQFEVIQEMARSIRALGETQGKMIDTQGKVLERLARIEAQHVHEAVSSISTRVNILETADAERRGAVGLRRAVMQYWPAIAMLFMVTWIAGRALGFFHLPDPPPAHVEGGK